MFYLFSGDCYYPGGGWDDFIAAYGKIGQAKKAAKELPGDWFQVVDSTTLKLVAQGRTDHYKEQEEEFQITSITGCMDKKETDGKSSN